MLILDKDVKNIEYFSERKDKNMDFSCINQAQLETKLIEFRRARHRMPENGWTEFLATSEIIHELQQLGISYLYGKDIHMKEERYGVPSAEVLEACMERAIMEGADPELMENMRGGYTGAVGILDTGRPGPTTAIRFDIDCNDVQESNDPNLRSVMEGYVSIHPKLMHACGHEVNTTIGIGVANIIAACKDQLCGKVMLIFQPSEEGGRGGESIARSGILTGVNYLFGGHVGPAQLKYGEAAAAMINFMFSYKVDLYFKGLSAHAGASPEKGHNAAAAAANAILNILAISRHSDGISRVNVGSGEFGPGRNVIPDFAVLRAEVRGATEELNEYLFQQLLRVCKASAEMYQCEFSYKITGHIIDCPCDQEMMDLAKESLASVDSTMIMHPTVDTKGGGEDVTFMMREVQRQGGKATYMMFGGDVTAPYHNSRFDINEKVLLTYAKLYSEMVSRLNKI